MLKTKKEKTAKNSKLKVINKRENFMDNDELKVDICYIETKDLAKPENRHLIFPVAYLSSGEHIPERDIPKILRVLEESAGSYVYAKNNDDVIGITELAFEEDEIQLLYGFVLQKYRGRGINGEMLNYIERHAAGFKSISTTVVDVKNNPSQHSLESLDFSIGTQTNVVINTGR